MNWEEFSKRFVLIAEDRGVADVPAALREASTLFEKNLPLLFSSTQLSELLGISYESLLSLRDSPERQYYFFKIPKRAGGYRHISQPKSGLAQIQTWILRNILDRLETHPRAMAFKRGTSILTNAKLHTKQRWVLGLDLVDFFDHVSSSRVTEVFRGAGYRAELSNTLAEICSLGGGLPQGAPTSPALSNLIFRPFDEALLRLALTHGLQYSRYADDLCFSGKTPPTKFLHSISSIVKEGGFQISPSKTRLMPRHRQQRVTGLIVNAGVTVPRSFRRKLRQELYYIDKFGMTEHERHIHAMRANRIEHLRGMAEFVRSITPTDPVVALADSIIGRIKLSP